MNGNELKIEIIKHKEKQKDLAEALGIKPSNMSKKILGHVPFFADEMNAIRKRYSLTDRRVMEIFFDEEVSKTDTEAGRS